MQIFSADIAREIIADRLREAEAARFARDVRRAAHSARIEASARMNTPVPTRVVVLPEAPPAPVREPERVSS